MEKLHLTSSLYNSVEREGGPEEGLNKLRQIQELMNNGRQNIPSEDSNSGIID